MKLDADDQEGIAQKERGKIERAATRAQTPKWEKSPNEIASGIANDFYIVTSLNNADLRRQIIKAIEAEREVTEHYMNQMGRWWARLMIDGDERK